MIKQLKEKNKVENKKARRVLDGGILVVATMYVINLATMYAVNRIVLTSRNILEIYKYIAARSYLLALVAFCQTALVLTGFSIDTVPSISKLGGHSEHGHYRFRRVTCLTNALVTACGFVSLRVNNTLQLSDFTRLGLPLILHGGSFMQVRGEMETEQRLQKLENAKYTMKGA